MSKEKQFFWSYLDFRCIKLVRHLCQVSWQFLSMTANEATKLRKGHRVKNVSFPHVSTEHYGALNTLPEQMLFGGQRGGHITSNLQRAEVFNPDGIRGPAYLSHTPQKPHFFLLPLFIFLQFHQVSSTETWPLLLSSVTSCRPQRTTGSLWSLSPLTLNSVPFI